MEEKETDYAKVGDMIDGRFRILGKVKVPILALSFCAVVLEFPVTNYGYILSCNVVIQANKISCVYLYTSSNFLHYINSRNRLLG